MESNLLLAIFVLLAATVALVPLANWVGLGGIVGYLAAGVIIGPYGLGLVSDTETIHTVADYGVILMLFLIGLELQPRELWRMRQRLLGLGVTQLVLTALCIGWLVTVLGATWQAGIIVGLALAMSSTAIAMQSLAQRNIVKSETGRGALAVLLVQDVAVIPVLAAIPLIVASRGSPAEAIGDGLTTAVDAIGSATGWMDGLELVAVFIAALLAGRFIIRPMMTFIAAAGAREAFTALALGIVIGTTLIMQALGLSPALGAFLGGVLLADSEYRHELQSNLEPFKGLLLGLFFISVGVSVAFGVIAQAPMTVLAGVVALVCIKIAVLYGICTALRLNVSDRLLLAILLSQAGEFAFVIFQFARTEGNFASVDFDMLTVVVAISMATTPLLLLLFDKLVAPRLHRRWEEEPSQEQIDSRRKVIVLGYGRFGQIVTRMLRTQGFELTLIDDDPGQIALVRRFGVKVFYGDGTNLGMLRSAGVAEAQMVVIAVAGRERITTIAELVRRAFPHVKIAARAVDRAHAHDLMTLGVDVFERETFRSAIGLGERALVALGIERDNAHEIAEAFVAHDVKLLEDSYALRHDREAYLGFVRASTELLESVLRADREHGRRPEQSPTPPAEEPVDKRAPAPSE